MANIIKPKRSNTASNVPTTSNLSSGELAVNMADKKVYINNGTAIVQVGAGNLTGLGDVVITTPSNGQSLTYNGTNWINSTGAGSGTVTSVSVVSANGFAGTVATATTTPAITLSTTITGLLKGNATAISAAVSGTDYAPATSGGSILYGNGAGGFSAVTVGTGLSFTTGTLSATNAGTVTSVTGTAPIASSGGATPAISIAQATTSVSGYLTSTDWNTFNNKQVAGSYLTATTGVTTFSGSTTGLTPSTATSGAITLGGTLAIANGGTGLATLTANNVILGAGTSTPTFVAPSTSGNVLTSNGTTWTSVASSSYLGFATVLFTASGSWTVPSGITQARFTVIAGGGGGGANASGTSGTNAGSGGGAVVYCTGLSGSVTITVGAGGAAGNQVVSTAGGASSAVGTGVSISCTGGGRGGLNGAAAGADGTATVTTGTALRTGAPNNMSFPSGSNNNPQSAGIAAIVWTVSSTLKAGAGGLAGTGGATNGAGGVGGLIMIEF